MFPKSIRAKFMLWLTFLLGALLVGFGWTAFELFRINQDYQVYEELQHRLSAVAADLSASLRGGPPPKRFEGHRREMFEGEPPAPTTNLPELCETNPADGGPATNRAERDFNRFEPESRPPDFERRHGHEHDYDEPNPGKHRRTEPGEQQPIYLSAQVLSLFDQTNPKSFYYAIWSPSGTERLRSSNAPPTLDMFAPLERASGPQIRTKGEFVESYLQHVNGYRMLVGRSIAPELAARRTGAAWMIIDGLLVLAAGLSGSWWLVGRALRPINKISAAASRISGGNLAERIDVSKTDDELGQLATTLNSTFARLEEAFTQQQQFTADASHELRTPLAVLVSEAQTTLARPRTAEEYRETIEACLDTTQQMRRLTDSLLKLARLDAREEPVHQDRVDLAQLSERALNLVRPLAEKSQLRLHTNLAPAEACGDADLLGQVITNLLTNAINYNKAAGEIHLTTRTEPNAVVLTVRDTGIGISAEDLPHIFDRFYRADKSRSRADGRNGLGLAISRTIVTIHGGTLVATSDFGVGSEFTLSLPRPR